MTKDEETWREIWRMKKGDVTAYLTVNIITGQGELIIEKVKRGRTYLDTVVIDESPLIILAQNILTALNVEQRLDRERKQ